MHQTTVSGGPLHEDGRQDVQEGDLAEGNEEDEESDVASACRGAVMIILIMINTNKKSI